MDSVQFEYERGRRNQPAVITATLILLDTVELARRGAPPAPKERPVPVWVSCDSTACGAAVLTGKINDRRLDDAHVLRKTTAAWPLPPALLTRLQRAAQISVFLEGRAHALSAQVATDAKAVIEQAKPAATNYSPRMQLYLATFATFGVPGDSTLAEDVGTATEPLMMPDANTAQPTRVATLMLAGRGAESVPMLVQDDATGAAPIFGVGEAVVVAMPGRVGRRAAVTVRTVARQRVDVMRDTCQAMKVWTYLVTLPPAELTALRRGRTASPRPDDIMDRWSGTAVRESFPVRMAPAEQRAITAARAVVAQFVREQSPSGVRERDVQVLAQLPRGAGLVTNFGVFHRDPGGGWRFPTLNLRRAGCESPR